VLSHPPGVSLAHASRWWPAALLSVPLALWGGWLMLRLSVDAPGASKDKRTPAPSASLLDARTRPLFLAYAGAGMGYILPMTFLPMIASIQLGSGHPMVQQSWLIVASATLPAAWLWNHLGQRLGDRNALLLNYTTQLASVLAALILPAGIGIVLCSLLMGGSFLGAVLLTQLLGPWLAREWLNHGGTLPETLWLGAGALAWALIWTWRTGYAHR